MEAYSASEISTRLIFWMEFAKKAASWCLHWKKYSTESFLFGTSN